MNIYHFLDPARVHDLFGKIVLDTTPNAPLASLLFMGGSTLQSERRHLTPYNRDWWPSCDHDAENMRGEMLMLHLYQNGVFGYARQQEYSTPEIDAKIDRLQGFIYDCRARKQDYDQYAWLNDAAQHIDGLNEKEQVKQFLTGPIIDKHTAPGTQTDLFNEV